MLLVALKNVLVGQKQRPVFPTVARSVLQMSIVRAVGRSGVDMVEYLKVVAQASSIDHWVAEPPSEVDGRSPWAHCGKEAKCQLGCRAFSPLRKRGDVPFNVVSFSRFVGRCKWPVGCWTGRTLRWCGFRARNTSP